MADLKKINAILERIEAGESENSACKAEEMARSTFRQAVLRSESGVNYARALTGLAEVQVEQIEKTIQDMRDGTLKADVGRIEVDARKWLASKFLPKRYGDKVDVTSDGKEIKGTTINIVDPGYETASDNVQAESEAI